MLVACGDCAVDPRLVVLVRPIHNGVMVTLRGKAEIWVGLPDYEKSAAYCVQLRKDVNAAINARAGK